MDVVSVHLHRAVTSSNHRNFNPDATARPSTQARMPAIVKFEVRHTGARTGPGELLLDHALADRLTGSGEDQIADVHDLGAPILSADLIENLLARRSQWTDLRHAGLLAPTGRDDHAALVVDHRPSEPQQVAKADAAFQTNDQEPDKPQWTLRQQPFALRVLQHPG